MMKKNQLALAIALGVAISGCTAVSAQNGSASGNPDFSAVTQAVDTNNDGQMSRSEWTAKGLPTSSFDMFEKGRGYVTQKDYEENAAPDGIDMNGDGMLTVAEFVAFDKQMSANMPPQDDRPSVSNGEKAYIALQVQNTMSKHAYYHAAGMNLEEVDLLWVSRDGEYSKSATFSSPAWRMQGVETVRSLYGEVNQSNRENSLKAINKLFPEIEITEANLGAGNEWAMHTNTTPIIEVAGDGKTAKGIWYSPGMGLSAAVNGNKATARGTFFWEKYAADFINENGQWKIWHLQMAYDFTPALPAEWMDPLAVTGEGAAPAPAAPQGAAGGEPPAAGGMVQAGESGQLDGSVGMRNPAYSYPSWDPKRPGLIYPRLPEPYYTFDETFSYCNCDAESYPISAKEIGIVKMDK